MTSNIIQEETRRLFYPGDTNTGKKSLERLAEIHSGKAGSNNDKDARTRILLISLNEFSEKGFAGVSTTQIANAAGVTQPLIHYHFSSKNVLWKAVIHQAFAWFNDECLKPFIESKMSTPEETMHRAIDLYAQFIERRPQFLKLILREAFERSPRLDWLVESVIVPATKELAPHFAPAVKADIVRAYSLTELFSKLAQASVSQESIVPLMAALSKNLEVDVTPVELIRTALKNAFLTAK
ncbi:MAG: TetR/AcrR family transcriptional regulator [Pseudomonadota bacterium]